MREFRRIYITPERIESGEADFAVRLLDMGWDAVHLRHPDASLSEMRRLIESIPQRYHRSLRLHGHFALASEFNLGGLHLNHRCPDPPSFYSGPVSRSCHSVAEVCSSEECDYVFLSPIFDSVSKPGYKAAFRSDELMRLNAIDHPDVIALGGITPERVDSLRQFNFSGFAVKGAINKFLECVYF